MILTKVSALVLMGALTFGAAGCANNNSEDTSATQSAREVEREDGSMVSTMEAPDGTVTEVRTFESGEVARVTRTTPPNARRTATVELRDGRKVELEDESDIENAMEASGEAIAEAARRTWDKAQEIGEEVGDKTEDVAGKAVEGAKTGAEKAKDAGEAVGKGVKKGVKKVGEKVKGDG